MRGGRGRLSLRCEGLEDGNWCWMLDVLLDHLLIMHQVARCLVLREVGQLVSAPEEFAQC